MPINISKFYYKDYYEAINFSFLTSDDNNNKEIKEIKTAAQDDLIEKNNQLTNSSFYNVRERRLKTIISNFVSPVKDRFSLEVMYPGLITGIGLPHEAKITNELKLGMHFDYTYGMPVIYGSSVKGVLRTFFKDYYKGESDVDDLTAEIFNGERRDVQAEEKKYNHPATKLEERIYIANKSIYQRDIFFDAVLTDTKDPKHRILVTDAITPHYPQGLLKNPVPITFLKIAPGCTVEFRFKLVDSPDFQCTATQKLEIFKNIIQDMGVGAKTNVGYGQFQPIKSQE